MKISSKLHCTNFKVLSPGRVDAIQPLKELNMHKSKSQSWNSVPEQIVSNSTVIGGLILCSV